jgi:hypothetical protein
MGRRDSKWIVPRTTRDMRSVAPGGKLHGHAGQTIGVLACKAQGGGRPVSNVKRMGPSGECQESAAEGKAEGELSVTGSGGVREATRSVLAESLPTRTTTCGGTGALM